MFRYRQHAAILMGLLILACVGGCLENPPPAAPSPVEDVNVADAYIQESIRRIHDTVERQGGWDAWEASLTGYREDVASKLRKAADEHLYVIEGEDGFLFHVREVDYQAGHSLVSRRDASGETYRAPALDTIIETSRQLAEHGIALIFVPVPMRPDLYPEKLSNQAPTGIPVSPNRERFILELLEEGVEVVDLLPFFVEHRVERPEESPERLYHLRDSHYTSRAINLVAPLLAERIRSHPFETKGFNVGVVFSTVEIEVEPRTGNERLLPKERRKIGNDTWRVSRVVAQGVNPKPFQGLSPVAVLGDSFVGYYADNEANIAAHIAKELRLRVATKWGKGMGPLTPRYIARQGSGFLTRKRVVVWIVASWALSSTFDSEWRPVALDSGFSGPGEINTRAVETKRP